MGRWLALIAGTLAGLALLGMALLTLADVVGRTFLRQPVPGATELTELGLVAVTFLLYPLIAWRRSHITVDLFDHLMRPAVRRALGAVGNLLGAGMFGVIGWQLWTQGERAAGYGDVTAFLRLPLGPIILVMAALSGLTALAFLAAAIRAPGDDDAPPKGHE
jgi:TRAP-type C4-dicarboxylate transport system permease small subunit